MDSLSTAFNALADRVIGWGKTAITHLPEFVLAVIVVVLAWYLAKVARRGMHNLILRITKTESIASLLGAIARAAVLTAGMFVALGLIGLDEAVTSMLAGVGIIGLALGFAFQDIAANFISGILLAIRRPFNIGDLIEVNGVKGAVKAINLRSTEIASFTGERCVVPNKEVLSDTIVNYSKTPRRRVDIEVGVAYGTDLKEALRVVEEAVADIADSSKGGDAVTAFCSGFGGSSIDLVIRMWLADSEQSSYVQGRSSAIIAIAEALDDAGISIPFPTRSLMFETSVAIDQHDGDDRDASAMPH